MKEKVTFSIDAKLMDLVRDNIPNKSKFVEDCFRAYLSFAIEHEEERGEELRQAWKDFHKAKLNIHLLMKIDYEGRDIENAINKQKTDAWLSVWGEYRSYGSSDETKITRACKILEIEEPLFKALLEKTLARAKMDMSKLYIFDDWNYVKENILPNVTVDEEEYDLDDLLNGKVDLD